MKEIIANVLSKELEIKKEEASNLLETPPSLELGDFAFPCFVLSQKFKKPPQEIARELSIKLQKKLPKEISKIENKGAYLNFFINKNILAEKTIKEILKKKENYGKGKEKEKILLEHTSVNPNASPHVGRARNSIIGDSIKRILKFSGNKIETHYYVNDISKQVAILALNFQSKDSFDDLLKKYVEASKKLEKNPKLEKKVFLLLHKFEHKDKQITELFKKIVDIAVRGQKEIFSSIGINFNYFDYESKYLGKQKEILKLLEKTSKLFKDEEGRFVLNQKGTGLETKMKTPVLVLTRSDGTGLYPLRDLAYTIEKSKKGKNIIVLGEDQKLYFEQLKQALILLKKPYPQVVHYSFILLKDIGKMSTRSGELVLLEEFISEAVNKARIELANRKTRGELFQRTGWDSEKNARKIGIGAIKYDMLRNENNKNITFDWQQALNFEGDSGPYLQYSYARASSIIKKSEKKPKINKIENLDEKEINLIKKLSEFPEIIKQARKQLSPHIIANYSFELAQKFNEFYHNCQVINSEQESFRLALVQAFRIVIKSALFLLGIEVMEEM